MARLESFRIAGLELWFNTLDHAPPHFHVTKRGKWEARIRFLGPTPREQKAMLREVNSHKESLLKEWERKVVQS